MSTVQIRTSTLSVAKNNSAKRILLRKFCDEYARVCNIFIANFWNHYNLDNKDLLKDMNLKGYKFYPKEAEYPFDTFLSGRSKKCAQTQAFGVIKSTIIKQKRRLNQLEKSKATHQDTKYLERAIAKQSFSKPIVSKGAGCELNTLNITFGESTTKTFDLGFTFKCLFNKDFLKENNLKKNTIILLCNKHKHFNKLQSKSIKVLPSVLVTDKTIDVRFEIVVEHKLKSNVIAIDQGIKHCITAVNGNTGEVFQSTKCNHEHNLTSIIETMTRRKRGSKGFAKAQSHRTNFVNWSINQLSLSEVKELRLEEIEDYGRGKHIPLRLRYFPVREIERKLQDVCVLNDVHLKLQSSAYRSQRCSHCGFVHNTNRVADNFECIKCMYTDNSDVNAARNHLADLKPMNKVSKLERELGFYWLSSGVLTVPNETEYLVL